LPHPTRHSLTETVFENVGVYSTRLGSALGDYGSKALLVILSKFLPWFKEITKSSVIRLERLNNFIKGKLDIKSNRSGASAFIRDIRDNADAQENGKIEG
jgi:hypothetical protein